MSEFVLLISDPNGPRRQEIIQKCADFPRVVIHGAATLGETYCLAESHMPMRIAVAAEIANSREFETLSKMIAMIGADLILYGDASKSRSGRRVLPFDTAGAPERLMLALLAGIAQIQSSRIKMVTPRKKPFASASSLPSTKTRQIIFVGASTGGIPALETVLKEFPADCPPTLVVQHIRSGFANGLVRRLNQMLEPTVVAAENGAPLENGVIYFATDPSRHLGVTYRETARTKLITGPSVSGHCPSVDVLFQQAALLANRFELRAALLTGMGFDGAGGMSDLRRAGALTIAQDRESSVVWGMPRVAIENGGACEVLPLDRIGQALLRPANVLSSVSARHKI